MGCGPALVLLTLSCVEALASQISPVLRLRPGSKLACLVEDDLSNGQDHIPVGLSTGDKAGFRHFGPTTPCAEYIRRPCHYSSQATAIFSPPQSVGFAMAIRHLARSDRAGLRT